MSLSGGALPHRRFGPRELFQLLSYLQYPAWLVALSYVVRPLFNGMEGMLEAYNSALLYAGVAVGMSSLQDPSKTQNEMSRRVWQNPSKGRLLLGLLTVQTLLPITLGLAGTLLAESAALAQLALGLVAFGLGMIGLLKTAIEMREHHRLDRHPTDSAEGAAA